MITGEEKETGTTWVNWRKMLVTLLPNFLEINIKKKDVLLSWVENTESELIVRRNDFRVQFYKDNDFPHFLFIF